jgi:hypothetical protein
MHVSCEARAAPSLARINSTLGVICMARFISRSLSALTCVAFLAGAVFVVIPFLFQPGTGEFAGEHLESDYTGLGSQYSNNAVRRDLIRYDVLVRDASGTIVGRGVSSRGPDRVERVEYLPWFPGIFEFASTPPFGMYFVMAVAFLVLGLLLVSKRKTILHCFSAPNQSSDPAFASGTSRAGHDPRLH